MNDPDIVEDPIPFGIRLDTGRPLDGLSDEAIRAVVGRQDAPTPEKLALEMRADAVSFAVEGGIDANDLEQAGWGVIYSAGVSQQIKDALQPLLDHRKEMAKPFKIFDGAEGYRAGDKASDWLKRRNVRMDVVNPDNGIPFYLLLVGSPDELPFEFQYSLDLYWGTGRLWFDTPEEFRHYADSVVAYEKAAKVPTSRHGVLFATEHDFDEATQLFTRQVAQPLSSATGTAQTIWARAKFVLHTHLGATATRTTLADILRANPQPPPALLVSGSHGLECPLDNPRQRDIQGAVVCQDWTGFGAIKEEHWFAASDIPSDAKLHGMMHFFFACHGGGCTEFDDYDRLNIQPRKIAERPFLSRMPQKMLAHPNGGALAVLAHVERAWVYSFQGARGGSQVQGFRDVLGRLLRGERIGQATDMFNMRWAAISTELSEMQADLAHGEDVPLKKLGNLWIARDDARNFIVIGDPAVRLRVEDMPPA
jgi:hypothetical protein